MSRPRKLALSESKGASAGGGGEGEDEREDREEDREDKGEDREEDRVLREGVQRVPWMHLAPTNCREWKSCA